ncbi:MAG: sialate O-acetylesterase, partial [Verrucomicrobiota bacterium]
MKHFSYVLALFFYILPSSAEIRIPSLFGDHMILQKKTSNAIWGWAEPDEEIDIEASWGQKA